MDKHMHFALEILSSPDVYGVSIIRCIHAWGVVDTEALTCMPTTGIVTDTKGKTNAAQHIKWLMSLGYTVPEPMRTRIASGLHMYDWYNNDMCNRNILTLENWLKVKGVDVNIETWLKQK
jgi:hypothetical protein